MVQRVLLTFVKKPAPRNPCLNRRKERFWTIFFCLHAQFFIIHTYLSAENLLRTGNCRHETWNINQTCLSRTVEEGHPDTILIQGHRDTSKLLAHHVHVSSAEINTSTREGLEKGDCTIYHFSSGLVKHASSIRIHLTSTSDGSNAPSTIFELCNKIGRASCRERVCQYV